MNVGDLVRIATGLDSAPGLYRVGEPTEWLYSGQLGLVIRFEYLPQCTVPGVNILLPNGNVMYFAECYLERA